MKVAVLFPSFLGGGAEAVCAWMLEALKEHDVTLITLSDMRLEKLDEQYGTNLAGTSVRVLTVPLPLPLLVKGRIVKSLSAFSLRQFYLSWYYRRYLARHFDLAISAFNEMDLGGQGIQYIHAPMFGEGHERVPSYLGPPDSKLRRVYKRTLRWVSGYSETKMRSNVTITNSQWTARWIERIYNIRPRVIYPPVFLHETGGKKWEEKTSDFIVVGRAVRHRKLERAIRICSQVRKAGFDIRLCIVAGEGDTKYLEMIRNLSSQMDWVTVIPFLSRKEYSRMLRSYKWGIQTMENEPWGIVVAEMVHAGIIPFVHAQGGTAEIVGNHRLLIWNNEDEAIWKIIQVMNNADIQMNLRRHLDNIERRFSAKSFVEEMQQLVSDFIAGELHT